MSYFEIKPPTTDALNCYFSSSVKINKKRQQINNCCRCRFFSRFKISAVFSSGSRFSLNLISIHLTHAFGGSLILYTSFCFCSIKVRRRTNFRNTYKSGMAFCFFAAATILFVCFAKARFTYLDSSEARWSEHSLAHCSTGRTADTASLADR